MNGQSAYDEDSLRRPWELGPEYPGIEDSQGWGQGPGQGPGQGQGMGEVQHHTNPFLPGYQPAHSEMKEVPYEEAVSKVWRFFPLGVVYILSKAVMPVANLQNTLN